VVEVLVRLARGEAGREGGSWVVVVVVSLGGGVVSLVMIWLVVCGIERRGKRGVDGEESAVYGPEEKMQAILEGSLRCDAH
jgi:hypothetical protein